MKTNSDVIAILSIGTFAIIFVMMIAFKLNSNRQEQIKHTTIEISKITENAYFEGQRNALNNDIRVNLTHDCWTTNPWNDNSTIYTRQLCK